jgi:transcriptional regulator with XRE-family HTH domain
MLGKILREAREAAGLTQEALAHTAGVDRGYISQLERDLKSPTISMLFRLCEAMQASPSALVARLEQERSGSRQG